MATTYTAEEVASSVMPRTSPPAGITTVFADYALTGALVVNDVVRMVKVSKGDRILDVVLTVPDLDTDATPAVVVAVGDGADDDRFITASDVGLAGGVARLNAAAGLGYVYTADDTIDFKVTTAPDASVTEGTIRLAVTYGRF